MTKVFIVVECEAYEGDTVLRVFNRYDDAIAYGEGLVRIQFCFTVVSAFF